VDELHVDQTRVINTVGHQLVEVGA
jgi:hypothetical protein